MICSHSYTFSQPFSRQCQQKLKLDWRRVVEAKANYEKKCKEEIYCNQFYHQEISKFGKPSKEAERVSSAY